jgi:hypothetical protein
MAHSCPEGYLPINEAFEQACSVWEGCQEPARLVDEAHTDDELADRLDKYDAARRRVERLLRAALDGGQLHPFYRAPNGQIERLLDREEWRREAFGVSDIDNIPHHVTSPGPDTEGQPVLLKISNFQEWLTAHRYEINPFRTGLPGRPTAVQLIEAEHRRRIDSGEALAKVGEEAKHLEKWLVTTHPRAPRTTAKTIENRIRKAHRNRART